jgi:hypothetical protein
MAKKLPKAGESVLFCGRSLIVVGVEDTTNSAGDPVRLVQAAVTDPKEMEDKRLAARKKLDALRAEQQTASKQRHAEIHSEIMALSGQVSDANFKIGLRLDLLDWWSERDTWVSEGRILSEDQKAEYVRKFGRKPRSDEHRSALVRLEG